MELGLVHKTATMYHRIGSWSLLISDTRSYDDQIVFEKSMGSQIFSEINMGGMKS